MSPPSSSPAHSASSPSTSLPKLRVLHVIASMTPEAGGPPAVCAGLAGALAANGHHVSIAAVENPGQTHITIPPGVDFHGFADNGNHRYMKSPALDSWLQAHIGDYDVVHLHSIWQFPTFAAARSCWQTKTPYVVLLNGMLDRYVVNQRSKWIKRAYWMWREGKIEDRSAGIHCLNEAEIRRAVPWISTMPKFVLGNGVFRSDIERLPAKGAFRARHPEIGDRPLALFLSRLHPKKGLDRLLPAWKALAQRRPEIRFAIAGAGDPAYVENIDRLIADNGLTGKVFRVGQLVGAARWEALVDADVFVLPSHQEGFSMAITEALAASCPAVITEECNFDEVETPNRRCGVIVRNGDMPAFASAVGALLDDPGQRQQLGTAGAALVRERYTWEKIGGDLEQIYRWILAGKSLPLDGRDLWRQP